MAIAPGQKHIHGKLTSPRPPDRSAAQTFADEISIIAEERAQKIEQMRAADLQAEEFRIRAERESRMDREPLSPAQWIENEYFCGSLARDVYPKLKELFIEIYTKPAFEVVLGGAIGWGKTSGIVLPCYLYSLYLLSCHGVPQRAFRGMIETDFIRYLNLNVDEAKAKASFFTKLQASLRAIPYFQRDFPPQRGLVNEARFPQKGILCGFSGATRTAAESENLIFCVLDEINLYDIVERSRRAENRAGKYDAAVTVYTAAKRRMETRFMLPDGAMPLPCKVMTVCRETYPDSFIRRRVREVAEKQERDVVIAEFAEWETKPAGTYEDEWFWIRTACRKRGAEVIEDEAVAREEERVLGELRSGGAEPDDLYEVIRVPRAGGRYVKDAKQDLYEFIRDVCGRATEAISLFYPSRESVWRCVNPGLAHPFSAETTTLEDGVEFVRQVCCDAVAQGDETIWVPKSCPSSPRFVRIDAGLTSDAAGIAVGHVCRWVKVERKSDDGGVVSERLPVVRFDLLLRVIPPSNGEIDFGKLRAIIYSLRRSGFRIAHVSMDQFQHTALDQPLSASGFEVEVFSVDKLTDAHRSLKAAVMEGRVEFYQYRPFIEELCALERVRKDSRVGGTVRAIEKIDHPVGGSKDVADAAAGVCLTIHERASQWAEPLTPEKVEAERPSPAVERNESDMALQRAFEAGDFEAIHRAVELGDSDSLARWRR